MIRIHHWRKIAVCLLLSLVTTLQAQTTHQLTLIQTSDVHGNFFPYDFIRQQPGKGSLARVASYVKSVREAGQHVVLLDNGDFLQGQPTAYYYNFIDTTHTHLGAQVLNYLRYDAATMGNHDVETGRPVFERWARACHFPILGANIIDERTHQPFYKPYTMIERGGVKIAVLGMITPAIPIWLPQLLWQGLYFAPMLQTAQHWMHVIQTQEQPDLIVGLFHSGKKGGYEQGSILENASLQVAQQVPGFDIIFMGHDHQRANETIHNVAGDKVLLIDPANAANYVSSVRIQLRKQRGKVLDKHIQGTLIDVNAYTPDADYMHTFKHQYQAVQSFVSKRIGYITTTLRAENALFGPSPFIDFIHSLQLKLTGADISFTAPLSLHAKIPQGPIRVSDMFQLYTFENMLYTMRLSGQEIKDYLEMSYALWTAQLPNADNHILLLRAPGDTLGYRSRFVNPTFNFDSAAGIRYTVDVTQPPGHKVHISSMQDGRPFDLKGQYTVAINSYRGNGGGELLTKGAGIPHAALTSRILKTTEKDLRYYMMQYIQAHDTIIPQTFANWQFIPTPLVAPAIAHDRQIIFGK